MTLRDLTEVELDSLHAVVSNKAFAKLIQSRIEDIKEGEWALTVVTDFDIARLAESKGMIKAWSSILKLEESIQEEKDIRKQEREKAEAIAAKVKR